MPSHSSGGGLPSGPRSRSVGPRSNGNSSRDRGQAPASSSQVRPQRSIASKSHERSRSRSRPPPMPESRQSGRHMQQSRSYDYRLYETRSEGGGHSRESGDSTSSSSLFDRVKGVASYASSLTSYDDDYDSGVRKHKSPPSSMRGRSLKSRTSTQSEPTSQREYEQDAGMAALAWYGDGYTLWSRVASAASELTVNVGKAWAANIAVYSGEETPPGQESRLMRAMKAYHLEKAASPTDLPPWLFDEHERRPEARSGSVTKGSRYEVVDDSETFNASVAPKPRGLRDVYDAAASKGMALGGRNEVSNRRLIVEADSRPSGATDRLKAIREAKRGGNNNGSTAEEVSQSVGQERKRIGLPSTPLGRTRN